MASVDLNRVFQSLKEKISDILDEIIEEVHSDRKAVEILKEKKVDITEELEGWDEDEDDDWEEDDEDYNEEEEEEDEDMKELREIQRGLS